MNRHNSRRLRSLIAGVGYLALIGPAPACGTNDDDNDSSDDAADTGEPATSGGLTANDNSAANTSDPGTSGPGGEVTEGPEPETSQTSADSAPACDGDLSPFADSPWNHDLTCLAQACCDVATACAANMGCLAYDACVYPCLEMNTVPDQQACIGACQSMYPPADTGYAEFGPCSINC